MRNNVPTKHFNRPSLSNVMPMDIPLVEADDAEPFEEAREYETTHLTYDEEKICDMATD